MDIQQLVTLLYIHAYYIHGYIHSYIHFYFSLILDIDSSGLTDILYLCYVLDVLFIPEPLNRVQGNLPQSFFLQNFLHI